jgi:hypothetical protein
VTLLPARVRPDHIRAFVADGLRGLGLAFGDRVFPNRVRPFWPTGLPGCSIYTLTSTKEIAQVAPRVYLRKLELVVEITAAARPAQDGAADRDRPVQPDDLLDELADEVEQFFERDQRLGGLVDDVQHKSSFYDAPTEGDERYGFLRLVLEVSYYTEAGEMPEGGVNPLRTVHSKTEVDGSPSAVVEDFVTLAPG